MSTSETKSSWFTPFLMVACAALAVVVVMLVRTNNHLKGEITTHRASLEKAEADLFAALKAKALAPGEVMEDLKLQDVKGMWNPRSFVTKGRSTLMLVASHGCEVCTANAASWETILNGPHPSCDPILIYIDAPPTPNDEHAFLPVDRFLVHNGRATSLGRITLIPATILIGPDGVIDGVWYGMLDEDMMRDISDSIAGAPE